MLRSVYEYTRIIQGTSYVTMSLILPMTAWLVEFEINPSVDVFSESGNIKHCDLLPDVQTARAQMHQQFEQRWVFGLDESVLEDYVVATLLDPRWKNWDFNGSNMFLSGTLTREKALGYLRHAWKADWKPATVQVNSAATPSVPKGNCGEASFMKRRTAGSASAPDREVSSDQLDKYLALPQELNDESFSVMAWWNSKSVEYPDLYRMARQFLGCPATTGGVERTFSGAGRMHDDLRKNTEEDTLEHMLRVRISD